MEALRIEDRTFTGCTARLRRRGWFGSVRNDIKWRCQAVVIGLAREIKGAVPGVGGEQDQLARDIAEVIPVSSEFISETMQGVVRARAITGVASVFGLLWASTAAFGAMRKGINAAWGVKKTRPFIKERLIDFGLTVGAGLLMVGLLYVTPTIGFFSEITGVIAPEAEFTRTFWNL